MLSRRPRPRNKRLADITFSDLYPERHDVEGKAPHTRGLCRCGCGERLTGRQRSWRNGHGLTCVQDYELRKGYSKAIRRAVFARDHGVCALCKIDADALIKAIYLWVPLPLFKGRTPAQRKALEDSFSRAREASRSWAFARGFTSGKTFWEADHIVPVVEGGAHELANLRTLCTPCHKGQTKALAGRRAAARKGPPPFGKQLGANLHQAFPALKAA